MGEKERNEFMLELVKVVSELNDLGGKLRDIASAYVKVGNLLARDPARADLDTLPNLDDAKATLARWRELTTRREELEKRLGHKITVD